MKKMLLMVVICGVADFCFCQPIKINDLNIPTSPAFVLLDKSPASIEKPSNPRALAVSLINVWQNSGAIEITPYWFKDRPAYTFKQNINNKAPILQTFAISAATAEIDSITDISVGLRTQLFRYYSAGITTDIMALQKRIIDLLSVADPDSLDLDAINAAKEELNKLRIKPTFNFEIAGAYMGNPVPVKRCRPVRPVFG